MTWPAVSLADVVEYRKEFISIDDLQIYRRPRVQLHAQGIVLRDEIAGAMIKTKKRQVMRAGELLVAEIDAKVGGFGIVPQTLDGAIVSSHYFLFRHRPDRIDKDFLGLFIRTPAFRRQVEAQGSTNYAAIRPAYVLGYRIPLPTLEEQRRVVQHIQAIESRVEQARRVRIAVRVEMDALLRSYLFSDPDLPTVPMHELVSLRPLDTAVESTETYRFAGVYSFGRGVFASLSKTGAEFAYKRLTGLRTGNFVYPKLMAWEGALGVVPPNCDGLFVSPEFPVFEVDETRVTAQVLDVYFKTPSVWPKLSGASTGTNVRRRRLNPKDFLAYRMPLPSREKQLRLRQISEQLEQIRRLYRDADTALESVVPAVLSKAFRANSDLRPSRD